MRNAGGRDGGDAGGRCCHRCTEVESLILLVKAKV